MKSAFKDRLNDALNYKNMKASELSRLSKVNEGAISQYRKGRYKAKQDTIEKLANALNVSIPWLMGADVPMQPLNLISPTVTTDVVTFPVLGSIAAGYEEVANEDWSGETVEIPISYLKGRKQSEFFVLKVHGNSMYPLYHENDKILILKQSCIEHNGDVGAVPWPVERLYLLRNAETGLADWHSVPARERVVLRYPTAGTGRVQRARRREALHGAGRPPEKSNQLHG